MRLTNFIAGCIVLTLTFLPLKSSLASIGEVTQLEGNGVIDRKDGDKGIVVEKELDVFSYDTVKTGTVKLVFQGKFTRFDNLAKEDWLVLDS